MNHLLWLIKQDNFYVIDPANQNWSVILEGRSILETTSFSSRTIEDKVNDVTNDIHDIRSYHNEGI